MDCTYGLFLISLLQEVLCQQWSVWLPAHIQALQGSCVVIPCNFTYPGPFRPSREFSIVWYLYRTTSYPEVYNKNDPEDVGRDFRGRTHLVGRLSKGNCSLQINDVKKKDADHYYPSIDERKHDFRFWDTTTEVSVSDTPEDLILDSSVIVTEGISVTIKCSAEHTCPSEPPILSWDKFQSNFSVHHEDLGRGRWRTVLVVNYYPVAKDHLMVLICSAIYPNRQMKHKNMKFFIKYPPKGTAAAVVGNTKIMEGDSVTLKCSSNGSFPHLKEYRWYEGQHKTAPLATGQTITVMNISWDSGPYFCTAQNDVGIGESALLKLHIHYAPKGTYIIIIPPDMDNIKEGDSMKLTCETNSSHPAVTHYSWHKDGIQLASQAEQTLTVEQMAVKDSGSYHCVAYNEVGQFASAPFPVTVETTDTEFIIFSALGGVAGTILLILLALVIFICISKRKKKAQTPAVPKHPLSEHVGTHEDIPMAEHLYGNIQDYLHVTDHNPGSSKRENPEFTDPKGRDSSTIYSQALPLDKQEEDEDTEDLHYSTIQHLDSHRTRREDAQPDDFVEYASVRK